MMRAEDPCKEGNVGAVKDQCDKPEDKTVKVSTMVDSVMEGQQRNRKSKGYRTKKR